MRCKGRFRRRNMLHEWGAMTEIDVSFWLRVCFCNVGTLSRRRGAKAEKECMAMHGSAGCREQGTTGQGGGHRKTGGKNAGGHRKEGGG